MRRRLGLGLRLALVTAGLAALVSFGLGIATYVEVDRFMVASIRQRLLATAPLVVDALRPGDIQGLAVDGAAGGRLAEHIRQSNALSGSDVSLRVVGSNGGTPIQVGPATSAEVATPPLTALRRATAAPVCDTAALLAPGHGPAMLCIVPLRATDEAGANEAPPPSGYLLLSSPLDSVNATLERLRLVLAVGLLAIIALGLTLSPALVRLGLGPLTQMAEAAEAMDTGDLGRRLPVPEAEDEVKDLARSFNRLLDRIEAAFAVQRRSEAQARQFAADASHELRSPLTVLAGSTDVLLMGIQRDPEGAERMVRRMQREIQRLMRLVQDLLLLARLDAPNGAALHMEPVWVKDLVQRAVQQMRPLAGDRALTLQIAPDARSVWVAGDDDQLYRILINLLDNAIRYTVATGSIGIAVQVRGDAVAISVADDGAGIPAEHLPHVFDRFYRADPSRTRETGNAGLGLAIARRSAEAHGGGLQVESEVGHGTRFTMTLPLLPVAEGATQPIPSEFP